MPMIEVTLPEGALDDSAKAKLVEQLTYNLLKWEGVPENAKPYPSLGHTSTRSPMATSMSELKDRPLEVSG